MLEKLFRTAFVVFFATIIVGFVCIFFAWLLTISPNTAAGLSLCFATLIVVFLYYIGKDLSYWTRINFSIPRRKSRLQSLPHPNPLVEFVMQFKRWTRSL